jgi:hypothetical protein
VGSGLTIDRGNIPVPKGVISKKQYNEIVKNKKLYYYNTGSKYEFEYKGNTFFTFSEIKDVVNYLEFTHYFNLSTFTWEPKYREDHLRNLATEHVELLIKNYQDNDIHFNKANLIRLRVNENLDRIVMRVLKKDVSLRDLAIKLEAQNIVNKVLFND